MAAKIKSMTGFKNVVIRSAADVIEVRSNLKTLDDVNRWITEYSIVTNTKWNVRSSKPNGKRMVCMKLFVCHHSSHGKVEKHLNKKGQSKNENCLASIHVKIKKDTRMTKRNDPYVKDGLRGVIKIWNNHSHSLETAKAFRSLPSSLKTEFYKYFDCEMGPTEALHHHMSILEEKNTPNEDFANARINPTNRTVHYWYSLWKTQTFGSCSGAGIVENIVEKRQFYREHGITVEFKENPLCVLVMTPMMKRAHQLPLARDIVYVDFLKPSDRNTHCVVFFLTVFAAGVAPLAIFITRNHSIQYYRNALLLIKNIFPDAFGGVGYPKTFIIDRCSAVMNALNKVWPESVILLREHRALQTVWQWLWHPEHKISLDDKYDLINRFRDVICSDLSTADNCFNAVLDERYPEWNKYITNTYYSIREKLILAYRDETMRQYHGNYFTEICARIFREHFLLHIRRPYNIISLITACVTMDENYVKQFCHFANSRNSTCRSFLHGMLENTTSLTKDSIIVIEENVMYLVMDDGEENKLYTVNVDLGLCSCPDGISGKLCKHQCVVHQFIDIMPQCFPPVSREHEYEIARLALGDKTPNESFIDELLVSDYEDYEGDRTSDECFIDELVVSDHEDYDENLKNNTAMLIESTSNNQCDDESQTSVVAMSTEKTEDQAGCIVSEEIEQEIGEIVSLVREKLQQFSVDETTLSVMQRFKEQLSIMSSSEMLESFLYKPIVNDVSLEEAGMSDEWLG